MSDVNINDVEITFDLEKITITEYRKMAKGLLLEDEDDALLARVGDVTLEWLQGLSQPKYRRYVKAFFDKAREPLADPN